MWLLDRRIDCVRRIVFRINQSSGETNFSDREKSCFNSRSEF